MATIIKANSRMIFKMARAKKNGVMDPNSRDSSGMELKTDKVSTNGQTIIFTRVNG